VEPTPTLALAVVVPVLNEEEHLPKLLESIAGQTHPPEQLVLVDDGSSDRSREIADTFVSAHSWASALALPARPREHDRLAAAAELRAFLKGVEHLREPWDVVVKLDADLILARELFQAMRTRFMADPCLGIAGSHLSVRSRGGRLVPEHRPAGHVLGPNKFYRRACFEQIAPIPPILGWDTIDDLRARLGGWRTENVRLASEESVHLRAMGSHDGAVRAFRRWGRCAWGYGAHPLWVGLGAIYRMARRPYVVGGLNYAIGWVDSALHRRPRAEAAVRARAKREEMRDLRARSARLLRPPWALSREVRSKA